MQSVFGASLLAKRLLVSASSVFPTPRKTRINIVKIQFMSIKLPCQHIFFSISQKILSVNPLRFILCVFIINMIETIYSSHS